MKIVDCIIDPEQLKWIDAPDGMELRICTIPAGATISSAKIEADGKFHIRYIIEDGEPCSVSLAVGSHGPLVDGKPCGHPGCLHHISHPCEGCGRIAGKSLIN